MKTWGILCTLRILEDQSLTFELYTATAVKPSTDEAPGYINSPSLDSHHTYLFPTALVRR